jgi:hypothetical protein
MYTNAKFSQPCNCDSIQAAVVIIFKSDFV